MNLGKVFVIYVSRSRSPASHRSARFPPYVVFFVLAFNSAVHQTIINWEFIWIYYPNVSLLQPLRFNILVGTLGAAPASTRVPGINLFPLSCDKRSVLLGSGSQRSKKSTEVRTCPMRICSCQRRAHRHARGQVKVVYSISLLNVHIHWKSIATKIAGVGKSILNTFLGLL